MPFTPLETLAGGALLHLSTSSLLSATGRVFGISGVLDGALLGDGAGWRRALVAGLVAGPLVAAATGLSAIAAVPSSGAALWAELGLARLAAAGLLVGFGSRLGSGCTSGHFLCGASRLAPRSLLATAVFFSAAVVTARVLPAPIGELPGVDASAAVFPAWWHVPALAALVAGVAWANARVTAAVLAAGDGESKPAPPEKTYTATQLAPYALSGLTFSLGLILSGMVSPLKVIGFLRFPPPLSQWDPSLALVFLGGVVPNAVHWASVVRAPTLPWESWRVPSRTDIDWRLVAGSALFGVGWGLAGVCPGPAVVAGGQLSLNLLSAVYAEGTDALFGADGRALLGWAAFADLLVIGMAAAKGLDSVLAALGPHVHPKRSDEREADPKADH
ncbi:hypothetical protein VHUM_04197 [Vanrija humicola]|uniref:Sulphur transport domain-containing protein n=1 Tax=Vanrija humicola TaxID=5417 RepID=A0A7D8Z5G3_VANHU|nr:hypothetical protein VHUM_04197 [Vanrija humicola]